MGHPHTDDGPLARLGHGRRNSASGGGWVTTSLKYPSTSTRGDEPHGIQLKDEPEGTDDIALPQLLTLSHGLVTPVTPWSFSTAAGSFLTSTTQREELICITDFDMHVMNSNKELHILIFLILYCQYDKIIFEHIYIQTLSNHW